MCGRDEGSVVRVLGRLFLPLPPDRLPERFGRVVVGLALFGLGISMFIASELGAAPWDVFHLGVSEVTGIPVGVVIEIVGFVLLLAWIPLRQRLGWATLLNAVEIGLVVLVILDHLPTSERLVPRVAYLAAGLVCVGVGTGLYIGAGLGSGPRDGIMLGLSQRGISVRLARTTIEALVLVGGIALGGTVGVGTAVFAFGIGPAVQFFLPRLRMRGERTVLATAH